MSAGASASSSSSSASASTAVAASQPGDHTVANGPISITAPLTPTFKRGTITTIADWCGFPQPDVYTEANVGFTWSAKSSAGPIVGYDIYVESYSGPWYEKTVTVPGINAWIVDYYGDCGGGAALAYGWTIVARDNHGNRVQAEVDYRLNVVRYDNTGPNRDRPLGTWIFTGKWGVSTCACADGGRQTYTTAKNATASYTFTATVGQHFAVMMAQGPGRGSFKIYQDGVLKATVNTHVAVNTNRVITWASGALKAGGHVFKIVNLATAGHARIDINAAMTD